MARPLRVHAPGVVAHVVSPVRAKRPISLDTVDYEQYLPLLANSLQRIATTCHTYCLLWNHLHLVVTPYVFPIWRLMHQVNSSYCSWFNARHGHVGHVLQGRYDSRLIDGASYFLNAIRYVALNPVMAGKVRRAEDWPWGGYRALLGLDELPSFVDVAEICRSLDADDEVDMRVRLKTFVEAGDVAEGWRSLVNGSEAFVKRMDPLSGRIKRNSTTACGSVCHAAGAASLLTGLEGGP